MIFHHIILLLQLYDNRLQNGPEFWIIFMNVLKRRHHIWTIQYYWVFFTGSSNKIKFQKFQNISKCSIHRLIKFNYRIPCELFERLQEKDNRGKLRLRKVCSLRGNYLLFFITIIYPHNWTIIISSRSCKNYWFYGM